MATTESTVTINPVTWFEIHTPDPERAKDFYRDVFGWTFTDDESGYVLVGQGEQAAIGGGIAPTGDAPALNIFNVQVPDVAAACERVVAAGGSVVLPAQQTPFGLSFAHVTNPDGAVFGVWCPPAA